ncbi:Polynucleotide adenylyltransferase family protein [Raphanus sativus]|nr:Polynucleotide adenylyltransferase family protein [Raphanus sativus]
MAISSVGFACRSYLPVRNRTLQHHCLRKIGFNTITTAAAAANDTVDEPDGFAKVGDRQDKVADGTRDCEWKQVNSKDLGITSSMIDKPTRQVLNGLRRKGHDVYLVGGCVRDLILKRTPRDFDILTSAELREVVRTFSRCEIVGRRFPICHVHVGDDIVENSSRNMRRSELRESSVSDGDEDCIRLNNCLQRDFTING